MSTARVTVSPSRCGLSIWSRSSETPCSCKRYEGP